MTLVVGRNGSGKSSFAEAAEVALTGTNARWAGRGAVWKEGWRNLHVTDTEPSVTVELSVDGEGGGTKVVRTWSTDDVDESAGWCQRMGEPRRSIEELGWEAALDSFRPFLSYSELGSMLLGKPSECSTRRGSGGLATTSHAFGESQPRQMRRSRRWDGRGPRWRRRLRLRRPTCRRCGTPSPTVTSSSCGGRGRASFGAATSTPASKPCGSGPRASRRN